jgi:hypothetical protein
MPENAKVEGDFQSHRKVRPPISGGLRDITVREHFEKFLVFIRQITWLVLPLAKYSQRACLETSTESELIVLSKCAES